MEEKLRRVLEKEYSESKLTDFLIKTQKVYEVLGYDFTINKKYVDGDSPFIGGKIWINEDYANYPISNIECIRFDLAFPTIYCKLVKTNLHSFNDVYSKLIDMYREHKDPILMKYINMVYGCTSNINCGIYSDDVRIIPVKMSILLSKIINEFKGHVIYVDTDIIFFRNFDEIKERFENYLAQINTYNLTYITKKSNFGIFKGIKNYIIEEDGNLRLYGMKQFNKDGSCKGGYIYLK